MMLGFLWGALALVLVAAAVYLRVARGKKDVAMAAAVFAVALMTWGVWTANRASRGTPVPMFDLQQGETYEFVNGFVFENALYSGVIGKDGELRMYRLPGKPPHIFRVKREAGNPLEFEDADPKHMKK